jgi:hypothetical protein
VNLGITDGVNTEVISGLNEGQQVIIGTVSENASNTPARPAAGVSGRGGPRF